jgi:hypothetical protein
VVDRATDRDLELARKLPDDFLAARGGSAQRLIEIVGDNWIRFPMNARAELVEALLPVVEAVLKREAGARDQDRGVCEAIVAKWMERQ